MRADRRTILALTAAAALLPGQALAGTTRVFGGSAFGSYWRGVFPAGTDERAVRDAVSRVVTGIDGLMSPWRPETEISAFNRAPAGTHALSPETRRVVAAALETARDTAGAFDPTVGPIVGRYGFGPIHDGRAGAWEGLELGPTAISKPAADLTLDLCGIAKGRALDRIVAALGAAGADNFVFELGGEVAARGRHPAGRDWHVAVEPGGGPALVVTPGDLAVATSGNAAQGYGAGGPGVGHIIDPARGAPAAPGLSSVSVFHREAMRADALATALFAMGRDRAEAFARAQGIAAILVTAEGRTRTTGGADMLIAGGAPA